jgi:hypothetical protein
MASEYPASMIWESIHAQRAFFHYHVPVARLLGITDAIFVCFLIWRQYTPEDQVELKAEDIESGTGLTYEMQKSVRKRLKEKGLLLERSIRLQHKTFFSIDVAKLDALLEMATPRPEQGNPSVGAAGNPHSSNDKNFGKNKTPPPEAGLARKGEGKAPGEKSEHQALIDDWHECFEAAFGTRYVILGGADGKAAKQLLSATKLKAGEIIKVATAAWGKRGKEFWACENKSRTIRDLAANWNRILAELDRPAPGQIAAGDVISRVAKQAPEGLLPESQRPTPGYDEQHNKISMDEYERRFPLKNYYDEATLKPLD